ncbi:hypothetical protein [Spirillospora sp. NPDC048824]
MIAALLPRRTAIEDGTLPGRRLASYRKLQREMYRERGRGR